MQVNITFRHFDPSDSLKAFTREKVERVGRFLDQATEASVVLSVEKHVHQAEVLLHSGPFFLRGREKSDDMYASIGLAIDKIERQIKRHKARLRSFKPAVHHREIGERVRQDILEVASAEAASENAAAEAAPPSSRVVRTNELLAKRMTVDEAVVQLELLENRFLVFTNAETGNVNVLYRRDGETSLGLIDARQSSST